VRKFFLAGREAGRGGLDEARLNSTKRGFYSAESRLAATAVLKRRRNATRFCYLTDRVDPFDPIKLFGGFIFFDKAALLPLGSTNTGLAAGIFISRWRTNP
jgi:hypothetical protein